MIEVRADRIVYTRYLSTNKKLITKINVNHVLLIHGDSERRSGMFLQKPAFQGLDEAEKLSQR